MFSYTNAVSTHSRPKAAGPDLNRVYPAENVSTHSRPKAAGFAKAYNGAGYEFQHTAARRRLAHRQTHRATLHLVSTHSRPKAAGGIG